MSNRSGQSPRQMALDWEILACTAHPEQQLVWSAEPAVAGTAPWIVQVGRECCFP
jgi:hypothetical protein